MIEWVEEEKKEEVKVIFLLNYTSNFVSYGHSESELT